MLNHYNYVNGVWEAEEASKEALEKRFANILALQKSEGIELVNNEDFLDWIISDWDESWLAKNGYPKPEFSKEFIGTFTPEALGREPAKNLRSVEDVEGAIDKVYGWRASNELEDVMMKIMGWSVLETPKGCSSGTESLLSIY